MAADHRGSIRLFAAILLLDSDGSFGTARARHAQSDGIGLMSRSRTAYLGDPAFAPRCMKS